MDPSTHITLGQQVLIKLPSNNSKICELKANEVINLGKFGAFKVNDIIGYQLGTTFEIYYEDKDTEEQDPNLISSKDKVVTDAKPKNNHKRERKDKFPKKPAGKVRIIKSSTFKSSLPPSTDEILPNTNSSKNNEQLIDIGSEAQKLSMKDIEELKKQSMSGEAIIAKMVSSHENFHKKTIYSQEKYLKRKKQKFEKFFKVEYLNPGNLLQYLLDKGDILRVLDISWESLEILLNLANIQPTGKYLVCDETGGLIVYAIMERMFKGLNTNGNGDDIAGEIVLVHENEHPNLDLLKYSNFSAEFIEKHVKTLSMLDYLEPPTKLEVESLFVALTEEQISNLKPAKKGAYYRSLKFYERSLENIKLSQSKYDGLIVASTLHLPSLIPRLSANVHGSRPIVCYSQFKEVLLELSHLLYDDTNYLAPSLLETRCRPYQTIRGRLHPLMTMRGGGGYLLWCQKVLPANFDHI
ncbi:related to tRNA (adenine(58)-N(1))-methyltransferase non-catalytic subunit TRM6 [Saccharomycodes ludwigii]|uniref:tRNA (adenine(58)-N(1))-methyltransferase non-catalytic subunit TRM6 n=1 Tax=Saccharomycodes ludwigii TaxID=36035 RepID=A0A376B7K1_9ASCO|nr:related to tRNA (adenine(58)-N(1))-methyltransferase non-catalytic subunit TRM6 [Saccharomycodes ludwigii]